MTANEQASQLETKAKFLEMLIDPDVKIGRISFAQDPPIEITTTFDPHPEFISSSCFTYTLTMYRKPEPEPKKKRTKVQKLRDKIEKLNRQIEIIETND